MRMSSSRLLLLGLGLALVVPSAAPAQPVPDDGRIRSVLTLDNRPVSVAWEPGLAADAHRALINGSGPEDGGVHVATIESMPLLRIGTLDGAAPEGQEAARAVRYDLWLMRDADGFLLDARWVGADGAMATSSGTIMLSTQAADASYATFAANIAPTSDETGRLEMRWGDRLWTADFFFADPPEGGASAAQVAAGAAGDGAREFEDSAVADAVSRGIRLNERHESAIVLPGGDRIATLAWQDIGIDHPDYAAIADVEDGGVIRLTEAAVMRLRSEVSLRFGTAAVPTGNLSEGFAGSYGLWLQRRGDSWRLIFNNEPDSWGTQHNSEYNASQTTVSYARTGRTDRPLGTRLVPTSADGGRLVIQWGPHEWAADFDVIR